MKNMHFTFFSEQLGIWFCNAVLMAKAQAGNLNFGGRTGVRIVVIGDRRTGKSTLIVTAATDNFPANVAPVLPPTRLPEDFYPERLPVTIVDTSSQYEF